MLSVNRRRKPSLGDTTRNISQWNNDRNDQIHMFRCSSDMLMHKLTDLEPVKLLSEEGFIGSLIIHRNEFRVVAGGGVSITDSGFVHHGL